MASYNEIREKDYETSVRNDAFRARVQLLLEDGAAYIVVDGHRDLLCRPQIAKRFWYETWQAFKRRYGDTPGFGD